MYSEDNEVKLNIAICDDENETLEKESSLIRELLDEKNITYDIDEYTSADKLLLSEKSYDMAFLDVEMDNINGIDAAKKLLESRKDTYIFFITNYSVYSDMASDIRAHRYLSKPVDRDRLSNGIDSALKKIYDATKLVTITDKASKKICNIPVSSVIFIENSGRNTKVYMTSGFTFDTEEIFSVVKERIEREVDYFAMPHQSYYVNMRFISDYDRKKVKLSYGQRTYSAIMSRTRYNSFNDKMFEMAKLL